MNINFMPLNHHSSYLKNLEKLKDTSSFTLIELLVVIALLSALSVGVILVINPAELIKQSRDATRLSDLQNINKSLGLLLVDCPQCSFGSSSVVYVSIPDTSPTCANLGLPSLPSGWSYSCSSPSNYSKIDGTGWIPVDFTKFSSGSPLSKLPVDPINKTSTGNYYTYVTGGSWALSSLFESQKYLKDKALTDGGYNPAKYEIGSDFKLIAQSEGLVGWWSFDEGSGTIAYDRSGNNNNGTLINGPTWTQGKVGGALSFDGVDDYVDIGNKLNQGVSNFSISVWINAYNPINNSLIIGKGTWNYKSWGLWMSQQKARMELKVENPPGTIQAVDSQTIFANQWYHVVATIDRNSDLSIFTNGKLTQKVSLSNIAGYSFDNLLTLSMGYGAPGPFQGYLDDVRIYNRALSPAEIKAIYDATK